MADRRDNVIVPKPDPFNPVFPAQDASIFRQFKLLRSDTDTPSESLCCLLSRHPPPICTPVPRYVVARRLGSQLLEPLLELANALLVAPVKALDNKEAAFKAPKTDRQLKLLPQLSSFLEIGGADEFDPVSTAIEDRLQIDQTHYATLLLKNPFAIICQVFGKISRKLRKIEIFRTNS